MRTSITEIPAMPITPVKAGAALAVPEAERLQARAGISVVAWDPSVSDTWHVTQERGGKLDVPEGGASTSEAQRAATAGMLAQQVFAPVKLPSARFAVPPDSVPPASMSDLAALQMQQRQALQRAPTEPRRSSLTSRGPEDEGQVLSNTNSFTNMLSSMMPGSSSNSPAEGGSPKRGSAECVPRGSVGGTSNGPPRHRISAEGAVTSSGRSRALVNSRSRSSRRSWETASTGSRSKMAQMPGLRTSRGSLLHLSDYSGEANGIKGILAQGGRLLGSVIFKGSAMGDDEEDPHVLWFTGLQDFKPLCHQLHRGRYMNAFFACAYANGKNYVLKKYDKRKMLPSEERGVRRMLAWYEELAHPGLVTCLGAWEGDDAIFVVEEYVNKGDILQHIISRPELYTESYVANTIVRPLLEVLAYLHSHGVIHRSLLPENVYLGLDDKPRLGHLNTMVDTHIERPKSRIGLLDYQAPEMFSVKNAGQAELEILGAPDSYPTVSDQRPGATSPMGRSTMGAAGSTVSTGAGSYGAFMGDETTSPKRSRPSSPLLQRPKTPEASHKLGAGLPRAGSAPSPTSSRPESPRSTVRQPAVCLPNAAGSTQDDSGSDAEPASPYGDGQRKNRTSESTVSGSALTGEVDQEVDEEDDAEEPMTALQRKLLEKGRLSRDKGNRCALDLPPEDAVKTAAAAVKRNPRPTSGDQAAEADQAPAQEAPPYNAAQWEQQDCYDEKVDIWQLGCLIHELLFGSLPFEDGDLLTTAAHMLWSDIDQLPPFTQLRGAAKAAPVYLPPDGQQFLQALLTKDPGQRPSAEQLLQHPWLERHAAGRPWVDPVKDEDEARKLQQSLSGSLSHRTHQLLNRAMTIASTATDYTWGWLLNSQHPRMARNKVAPASAVAAAGAADDGGSGANAAAARLAGIQAQRSMARTISQQRKDSFREGSLRAAAADTRQASQRFGVSSSIHTVASLLDPDASASGNWGDGGGSLKPRPPGSDAPAGGSGRRGKLQQQQSLPQLTEDDWDLPPSASGRYDGVYFEEDDGSSRPAAPVEEGPVQVNGRYGGPSGLRLTPAVLKVHDAGPKAVRPPWEGLQT